jgi:hypothetical protein
MLYYLLVITESGFDYPQLMQNISLGLLALFTPLALFLFSPSKENENGLFFFDKMVILDQVLK